MNKNAKQLYQETILVNQFYIPSLINDIRQAAKSIDLGTYIFSDDAVGKEIVTELCQAAKRGVTVRVLADGIGTSILSGEMLEQLKKAGVATKIFHPLPWLIWQWWQMRNPSSLIITNILRSFSEINSRHHSKICIIDKKIVYVGSANISINSLTKQQGGDDWRETVVRLSDVNTHEIDLAFEKTWEHFSFRQKLKYVFKHKEIDPIFRINYNRRQRRILYLTLLTRIEHCQHRIWITNSYFVPDNVLLKKLINAAKKGIDVRIILPNKCDVFIVSLASFTFYSTLLKNGVAIYEYLPSMLHAKVLILDDWYCVGSTNLNSRSIRHDFEIDVCIQTDSTKKILEQQFISDLGQSKRISINDIKKRSRLKMLIGRLLLIIRYLL